MTMKSIRYVGLIFSLLLVGCDELHFFTTFEEDGSGFIDLEVVNYPDGEFSDYESIEDCSADFDELGVQPDNIAYESYASSAIGQQNGARCIYTFEFDDLEEAARLHTAFELNLDQLYFHNDAFTYQASSDDCDGSADSDDNATWNLRLPGEINSHNADKVIGDQLTWNVSSDCYDIFAESTLVQPSALVQPEQESRVNDSPISEEAPSEDESANEGSPAQEGSLDSAVWIMLGASMPILIGGIVAYVNSRKINRN